MGVLTAPSKSVTLYQGDDLERLAELHQQARVAAARAEAAERKAAANESRSEAAMLDEEDAESAAMREWDEAIEAQRAAENAYDEFVDVAAGRAVEVRVRAIGSTRFSDLLLAHGARTTLDDDGKPQVNEDDLAFARVQEMAGLRPVLVDVSTFPRALAAFRDSERPELATIIEPELTAEELADFVEIDCTDGNLERIWTTAFFLNRGVADPKGSRFSTSTPS